VPAPALRELQRAFWRHLAAVPGDEPGRPVAPALQAMLVGSDALPAADRLAIYERMYFWRLLDVLREDHPRTAAVLGDEAFRAVAQAYLARHPSEDPSVAHVGRGLASFLEANLTPGAPPWTADLARLEWARREVFDAADAPVLTLDALRAIPSERWSETRFRVVPAFTRLVAGWPVQRAWATAPEEGPATLAAERTALRVWRSGFAVYHAPMSRREEAAFASLVAGERFAALCEAFADLPDEEAASQAATLLLAWVEDGMIAGLDPERRDR